MFLSYAKLQAQNFQCQIFMHYIACIRFSMESPLTTNTKLFMSLAKVNRQFAIFVPKCGNLPMVNCFSVIAQSRFKPENKYW